MASEFSVTGRFAPSPSGVMHLGNLASSLLAWLDAKADGGEMILRMEDLDPERSYRDCAVRIADDLSRLGLYWDRGWSADTENEYAQSRRTPLYEDVFEQLMRRDMLYRCYCSRSQRLAAAAPHPGESTHDPGCRCRYLSAEQRRELERSGRRPAWKVKVPDRCIRFRDGVYGEFCENLTDSGDFIIRRSDGVFAYQLAVSFDDMDMGVSRVVRGRDLLGSTARQIWLITELGGTPPEYRHAPLLTASDKRKLSKRDGDLNMLTLSERYSPEELLGLLSGLLGLGDGSPCTASELLEVFEWSKVPRNDILI